MQPPRRFFDTRVRFAGKGLREFFDTAIRTSMEELGYLKIFGPGYIISWWIFAKSGAAFGYEFHAPGVREKRIQGAGEVFSTPEMQVRTPLINWQWWKKKLECGRDWCTVDDMKFICFFLCQRAKIYWRFHKYYGLAVTGSKSPRRFIVKSSVKAWAIDVADAEIQELLCLGRILPCRPFKGAMKRNRRMSRCICYLNLPSLCLSLSIQKSANNVN